MDTCSSCLRTHAERILSAAMEFVDPAVYGTATGSLVASVSRHFDDGTPIDVSPLRDQGAPDRQIARVLRAVQAECIEVFRQDSTDDKLFSECILKLRKSINDVIPHPDTNSELARFFHQLLQREFEPANADHEKLLALFDGVLFSFRDMVYVHDLEGTIHYLNQAGLELTQYTHDDILKGISVYDFVTPESLDLVESRMETPKGAQRSPYTIEIYTKAGQRILIEIQNRLIMDKDENPWAVVGIVRDLRFQRRLGDEIASTNDHLQCILNSLPAGVLIVDRDLNIAEANPTAHALCGSKQHRELIGYNLCQLSELEAPDLREALLRVLDTGEQTRQRLLMNTRFGAPLHCDVVISPLMTSGGLEQLLVLLIDVSEFALLQQSLVHVEKLSALGEVISSVAHEMNNPLTGVMGYAQLLLGDARDEKTRERLQQILEEGQRCKMVVENLLTFSQHGESDMSAQNANELVNETAALCLYQLRTDGIELVTELEPDLPSVEMNPRRMQRALLNILNNAQHALVKSGRENATITLSTSSRDNAVRIQVSDNGPGIPLEHQNRVFDPFYTSHDFGEAIGLGLSVAYGIVQDHGGNITLQSTPGAGATFTIILTLPK